MDIPRPDQTKAKRKKRILLAAGIVVALAVITVLLARLKPAAPSVERNLVWIDTVKRGEMLRQVRGLGTLVPEEITWIAARTQGRVDKIVLRPGADVSETSVILILTNPDVVRAATDADSQLKAAEAELANLKVTLESSVLAAESTAATAKADYEQAKLRAEVNDQLFQDGLVSPLEMRLTKVTAEQAATRNTIEQKRYAFAQDSIAPQLAVKAAEVDRLRSQAKLRQDELDALTVRAGMTGVLQLLPVEVGAQVQPGTNLARVADPHRLKAEVRVAETQAKDIQIGQPATIDTRNGIAAGKVSRIDPSVQNGTVTVDVTMTQELPRGARPDLSVDGTIELERLNDVVYVGRPAFGQEHSTVGMFKLDADGIYATRTQVQLGRSSVNTIEIVNGLQPGDRVILSDMSQWDANDRIKLN
ncbi:efflux RND transporter periplasmic adaptor subunit [Horticoccus luteus]|uniref:Efflux RND transporter periplasmic adaptor subunit n=1 Tax=Horticoccus luteus TaxID=2862869 RepID=A0A8F9TZ46_9BACT|nr:efflux RND transporter periplasmic adaptor subunit [Horticoccus luteus]QYM80661.1 efflux RND transporter periplasmic adaptor subunit [Horticoccus luteus]